MTTRTASLFGTISSYKTGETLRQATSSDWLFAKANGDAQTGAHIDREDGVTVVFCDGPQEMTVDMARAIYVERFDVAGNAIAFEEQVLSVGREFLPACALTVLDGGEATVAYYDFLTEQHAAE